jgi:enterochelin esterase family protein
MPTIDTLWRSRPAAVALSCALLLGACAAISTPSPAATPTVEPSVTGTPGSSPDADVSPIAIETLDDLQAIFGEIATAAAGVAQRRGDELWEALVRDERVPLVIGEQVIFLYKGDAEQVHWRGSFNGWSEPGLAGSRVGQTDLWIGSMELPAASRAEYKIVRDGDEWLVDPANPRTTFSGLSGVNNVVVLPGFTVTDESQARAGIVPGTLTGDLSIASRHLGYTVDYRVYTPAGYEDLEPLPVLYVLDGNDFVDERMGALPTVLDNLIASGRIRPVIAVFADAREPGDPTHNRREDEFLARPVEYARFIVDELVQAIDGTYRTDPDPDARAIVGVSYGGLSAAFIAATQSEVFHNLAAFSPSLWVIDDPENLTDPQQVAGARLMQPAIQGAATCDATGPACVPIRIFLSTGLPDWDVGDLSGLAMALERLGYRVDFHQVREGHTWDQWRGLSDEMLTFLYGAG